MEAIDRQTFSQAIKRFAPGARLLCAWDLEGGVSARTVAVEFERPTGGREKAVVRLHGEVDRVSNSEIASDEFRLLKIVRAAGIPAPLPLFLDASCELFEIPYLVVSFVEGETDFDQVDITKNLEVMAEQLAAIHRVDWSPVDLSFLPAQEMSVARRLREQPDELDERLSEGRIREALKARWPPLASNVAGLLHGDYWPGNILWQNGELAAVIDWEDAAIGDPLADLGNSRLEILWSLGPDAADTFSRHYRSLMSSLDYTNLALWDLHAALRPAGKMSKWGLDAETESRWINAHRWFVDRALADLAGRGSIPDYS